MKVRPDNPLDSRSFGGAIAAGSDMIAVVVSGADGGAGTAVVLRSDGKGWVTSATLMSESEGLDVHGRDDLRSGDSLGDVGNLLRGQRGHRGP